MSVATDLHATALTQAVAREAALLALMDALGCACKALQDPECVRMIGALVPGATMAFGARVPGTSYQLDPVHAAFNVGTLVSWHGACDTALASQCGHLADNLGAILAVADYRSRKAIAEGIAPLTVHDLLTAVVDAHQYAMLEWTRRTRESESDPVAAAIEAGANALSRCDVTAVASAVTAASLFGGTTEQVATAAALARDDRRVSAHGPAPVATAAMPRWSIGDATSRGVRLALIALALPPHGERSTVHVAIGTSAAMAAYASALPWHREPSCLELSSRIRDRFQACVTAHYPAAQAGKISALFAEPEKLQSLPVSELVSTLVRN